MALTTAYLITTKNLDAFLNAIRGAKAPERFTNKFLRDLDFTSSNDRLYLGILKSLGMIDEAGVPTTRYYAFLDEGESGRILADAVREAYEDLFAINKRAQDMSVEEVRNKLRTLTQGQKSDKVIGYMANTFKALAGLADWDAPPASATAAPTPAENNRIPAEEIERPVAPAARGVGAPAPAVAGPAPMGLHYDMHIHLPESRDPAVFDAIFQAMKRHLGV